MYSRVIPIVPGGQNLAQSVAFYKTHLGFEQTWEGGGFVGLKCGEVDIMLQQFGEKSFCENYMFRLQVKEIDALYARLKAAGVPKLGPLEMKPWNAYEFHLLDPAGVLIQCFK